MSRQTYDQPTVTSTASCIHATFNVSIKFLPKLNVNTDPRTIQCLELRMGIYAEEMVDLSRRHARGENVAAEKMQTQASIDVLEALVGGLRRNRG